MEQRSNVTILIILLYCVPYVFLGMYGDKIYHNLWLYGLMIVAMAGLSRYCRKTKRIHIIMEFSVIMLIMQIIVCLFTKVTK